MKRVICDCDNTMSFPGRPMDDALAILYLLGCSDEIDLLGITANYGNGSSEEALGALLWWYFRNRQQKEQTRLRMQAHIHAEQMSDSRLKTFINISHELRTPMTLIFAPLETLMKGEKDPRRLKIFNTIKRNANRMMSQLNSRAPRI